MKSFEGKFILMKTSIAQCMAIIVLVLYIYDGFKLKHKTDLSFSKILA